jgi:hypothetical protein
MGFTSYCVSDREYRAESLGYHTKSIHETFSSRQINNAMNPHGIKVRESRDSDIHPKSLGIVLALDLTGSMGSIPAHLVKDGLPNIMSSIMQKGIKDPQILFTGVGDHECDSSPLQVGQFESGDAELDKWLTSIYLEGGGGGNYGESYLLAWYFAGFHTSMDCFEKRKQKGFLFTIGDEPTLKDIPKQKLKELMGDGQYEDYTALRLLDKAKETFNVYHLHIREGSNGRRQEVIDGWKQLMGDNLIVVDSHKDVSRIISDIVTKNCIGVQEVYTDSKVEESKEQEIIL